MKYNVKINEDVARLSGFSHTHPLQDPTTVQGNLALMYSLQEWLMEIGGFAGVSLQPAAGAHGELTGILILRAYHRARGQAGRTKILIPDSAHGTNPASTAMAGMEVIELRSDARGNVDLESLRAACDDTVAGLMLTNPNTLGLFEEHLLEVVELVHRCGGLVYGDGANMNALLGVVRPGDLGFDVIQFNLHKTFSTPHGGGGPGSGPVGVKKALEPYLPKPRIIKKGRRFSLDYNRPKSIGRLKAFYGNFGIMVRAYSYIRALGPDGLKKATEMAVLNANYVKERLKSHYHLPYDQTCMHESVFSDKFQSKNNVHTLDIAKRLIDYGFHPPTIYFPLIVPGAIMIEPTETETKETLDRFIDAMINISKEADEKPDMVRDAPQNTRLGRLDEVKAARNPVLRWKG